MRLVDERVSTEQWCPRWIRYQHVARYRWLSPFIKDCLVVEAASGTGYGAEIILKGGAKRVDCFDTSAEAIQTARERYPAEGLHFELADVLNLPVPDHYCDAFVSLETIEHIEDDRGFLAEVRRVLKPGAKFICSTPNRTLTNPGTSIHDRPFNPYHVREYTFSEFESLLRSHFGSIDFYWQSEFGIWYSKLLSRIGGAVPRLAARLHQARKLLGLPREIPERHAPQRWPPAGEPEVLIAVCEV